jgi:transposase
MFQWVQKSPDQTVHKTRMAIWLTHTGRLHAGQVADILGVSRQAVWLWIRQYNQRGPAGLERPGRGGRRWGYLTPSEERALLEPLIRSARSGRPLTADTVQDIVEARLERKVSRSYIYKLLHRHGWRSRRSAPAGDGPPDDAPDTFEKLSQPWQRHV